MKEKDKLERFIEENRTSFDVDTPSTSVWSTIKFKTGMKSTAATAWYWKVAAILFFASSVFLYWTQDSKEYNPRSDNQEFAQVESYYLEQIESKRDLVLEISHSDFLPNPAVELDLQRLSAMYQVLKEEYEKQPTKGVREALMLNLLIRSDILNDELARVENLSDSSESETSEI